MAPKSDKEGKGSKKSAPQIPKDTPEKPSPKSKKADDDDDDDLDDDDDTPKASSKKPASKAASKSKKDDDAEEDDDGAEDFDEVDEWEKVEEEEEWDPDFDEFDIPKSKTKKATGGNTSKKPKAGEEDDLGLDEDFKDLDLFNDSGFEEEEDDF
jgi:DNA-directed RNA polymerase subunit delta